jgi:hypothetical protein
MKVAAVHALDARPSMRAPVLWGFVFGAIQVASPLGLAWLESATVYALLLCFIAAVYVGFAVADGRPHVIAIESVIAAATVLRMRRLGRRDRPDHRDRSRGQPPHLGLAAHNELT